MNFLSRWFCNVVAEALTPAYHVSPVGDGSFGVFDNDGRTVVSGRSETEANDALILIRASRTTPDPVYSDTPEPNQYP